MREESLLQRRSSFALWEKFRQNHLNKSDITRLLYARADAEIDDCDQGIITACVDTNVVIFEVGVREAFGMNGRYSIN